LIDEKGNQAGVVSFKEALQDAKDVGLDLVEISPNAVPPVVKIMNYGKFKYKQDKQKTISKKKQKKVKLKEIKFRPGTDKGDYKVKTKNLRNFLEKGDKVKVTVWLEGEK
jgi:translation initiation factor IF-3